MDALQRHVGRKSVRPREQSLNLESLEPRLAPATGLLSTLVSVSQEPGRNLLARGTRAGVAEGGHFTAAIRLTRQPSSDITVSFASLAPLEVAAPATTLLFTKANWNHEQIVSFRAVQDGSHDGDHVVPVSMTTAVATRARTRAIQYILVDSLDSRVSASARAESGIWRGSVFGNRNSGSVLATYDSSLNRGTATFTMLMPQLGHVRTRTITVGFSIGPENRVRIEDISGIRAGLFLWDASYRQDGGDRGLFGTVKVLQSEFGRSTTATMGANAPPDNGVTTAQYVPPVAAPLATPRESQGESRIVLTGLYNAYSPEVFVDPHSGVTRMLVGGWAKPADRGSDRIYASTLGNTPAGDLKQTFVFRGHHANDPSVVVNPLNPKELLMFFTALKDSHATPSQMMRRNWTAVARSTDGGMTWRDARVVIGQDNALDSRGAWSPSAVVVGSEIWVYYHTNQPGVPHVYRTRLKAADLSVIATEPVTTNGTRLTGINVDVERHQGTYHMLVGATLQHTDRYTSADGLRWTRVGAGPIVRAGAGELVVTAGLFVEKDGLSVSYSVGPVVSGSNYRFRSVHVATGLIR